MCAKQGQQWQDQDQTSGKQDKLGIKLSKLVSKDSQLLTPMITTEEVKYAERKERDRKRMIASRLLKKKQIFEHMRKFV